MQLLASRVMMSKALKKLNSTPFMAAVPADAAAAGVAPAGTTGGARAVRDRTGGRAAVHGVPSNVARSAGVLPNTQTTFMRYLSLAEPS